MKRFTVYSILRFLFRNLTRVEVLAAEKVPAEGPVILATNHMSRLDVPLLMITTPRQDLIALVADKYKTNILFSFLVQATGSIWLDRKKADFTAFRSALDFLHKGGILGIAPEGTRSTVKALLPGKPGAVLLAEKARVPLIPVGITGTEDAMSRLLHLRRPEISVRYGDSFTLPPMDRDDRDGWLQQATDEIMCRIAVLLPDKYHGAYAGHPRLLDLQAQAAAQPGA
jgi:1-acyl-sn-glycerol-3-phosphate acyltransferase